MSARMQRRAFLTLVGGATLASPRVARAQQQMPVVGFLNPSVQDGYGELIGAFHDGLKASGFVEGRNVSYEYRWAEDRFDRLPGLASDLVRRGVNVIATTGVAATLAAKAASSTVPVVFYTGNDPVKIGLVKSFNRPGGNVTGVSYFIVALAAKRLELLRDLLPGAVKIAILYNPSGAALNKDDVEDTVRIGGQQPALVNAGSESEIDTAFATMGHNRPDALLVLTNPVFTSRRDQIIALAAHHKIPTIYPVREFVTAGGLASYGTNIRHAYREAGVYAARILKGEKPADLPVLQATRFETVVNLKTAKALGLTVPPLLLARADEVIE